MSITIRRALAPIVLLLAGCSDEIASLPDLTIVAVEVSPADRTLSVGDSMVLTASPKTADGQILGGLPVVWSSTQENVLSVRASGIYSIVRAIAPGTAEISAAVEGKLGKVTVTVIAAPIAVATVQIAPSIGALEVGKQFQLVAVLRAADSTVIGGRTVTWQSSDPTIASLVGPPDGARVTMTAQRAGDVVITASAEGKMAQRTIRITPALDVGSVQIVPDSMVVEAGKEFQLSALLWGPNGYPMESSAVQWNSSDNTIAAVTSVNGQRATITSYRAGKVVISAEAGGRTGRGTVTVYAPAQVASVEVNGNTGIGVTLWEGQLHRFTAVVNRTGGGVLTGYPVSWRVEDPTIAELRADGVVRALQPGKTRVVAEAGGKKGYAYLTVFPLGSNGMMLELQPNQDPWGFPRVTIAIATTTWTDVDGTTYPAEKRLVGGTLNVGRGISGYEQRLEIDLVVLLPGYQTRVVGHETLIDRGQVMYNAIDPLAEMWLISTMTPGRQLHTRFLQPGRLLVPQMIGSAPSIDYLYLVK